MMLSLLLLPGRWVAALSKIHSPAAACDAPALWHKIQTLCGIRPLVSSSLGNRHPKRCQPFFSFFVPQAPRLQKICWECHFHLSISRIETKRGPDYQAGAGKAIGKLFHHTNLKSVKTSWLELFKMQNILPMHIYTALLQPGKLQHYCFIQCCIFATKLTAAFGGNAKIWRQCAITHKQNFLAF